MSVEPIVRSVTVRCDSERAFRLFTEEMGSWWPIQTHARAVTEFHDDLYAKALVFEQDGSKAAVVSCDLISLPRYVVLEARDAIGKSTKVPPQHVMISATHTHTGPVIPSRSSRDSALGGDSDLSQQYVRKLPELIAQAVRDAEAALAPAKASREESYQSPMAVLPPADRRGTIRG